MIFFLTIQIYTLSPTMAEVKIPFELYRVLQLPGSLPRRNCFQNPNKSATICEWFIKCEASLACPNGNTVGRRWSVIRGFIWFWSFVSVMQLEGLISLNSCADRFFGQPRGGAICTVPTLVRGSLLGLSMQCLGKASFLL